MEGVGGGIGRVEIDFAGDAGVAGGFGTLEKFGVESAGVAFAAGGGRGDDSVYIDEIGVEGVREEPRASSRGAPEELKEGFCSRAFSKKARNQRKLTCW